MTTKLFALIGGERKKVAEVHETVRQVRFGRQGFGYIFDRWNEGTGAFPTSACVESGQGDGSDSSDERYTKRDIALQGEFTAAFPKRVQVRGLRTRRFIVTHETNN